MGSTGTAGKPSKKQRGATLRAFPKAVSPTFDSARFTFQLENPTGRAETLCTSPSEKTRVQGEGEVQRSMNPLRPFSAPPPPPLTTQPLEGPGIFRRNWPQYSESGVGMSVANSKSPRYAPM